MFNRNFQSNSHQDFFFLQYTLSYCPMSSLYSAKHMDLWLHRNPCNADGQNCVLIGLEITPYTVPQTKSHPRNERRVTLGTSWNRCLAALWQSWRRYAGTPGLRWWMWWYSIPNVKNESGQATWRQPMTVSINRECIALTRRTLCLIPVILLLADFSNVGLTGYQLHITCPYCY